jgi:hypothetical protein
MMEALRYSGTSVLTRSTRRNIPEDDILHSHRRENLKSYKFFGLFVLCAADDVSSRSTRHHRENSGTPVTNQSVPSVSRNIHSGPEDIRDFHSDDGEIQNGAIYFRGISPTIQSNSLHLSGWLKTTKVNLLL